MNLKVGYRILIAFAENKLLLNHREHALETGQEMGFLRKIRPVVETTMPLEDVARAHQLMEDGGHAGKIVLTV